MGTSVERSGPSTQRQQEILNFCQYLRERIDKQDDFSDK